MVRRRRRWLRFGQPFTQAASRAGMGAVQLTGQRLRLGLGDALCVSVW
jgi:hypothetical protein